jgi:hypothetical protein
MIHLPQRSVTRFFIPLIDVLTLLFCIFLLQPMAKSPARKSAEERVNQQVEVEKLREAQRQGKPLTPEQLEKLEEDRKEKVKQLEKRLDVHVLEIDPATGHLFYRNPGRIDIPDQDAARELIERHRRKLRGSNRDLYYLILYPRDRKSKYPDQEQEEKYTRWFEGVALGYDTGGA